ncbi:MAG: hypothetical protein RMM17_12335 [Acidobacteriota bacterium]|nr:hypothetical protein [Blastocatellia bacterium]MDW8413458.1 hypothetical protein [Acidobacteriota bacterium]
MSTTQDIEQLRDEAMLFADRGHQHRPKQGDWGFYAYDDSSAGYRTGAFMWFESKPELLLYLGTYEALFAGETDPIVVRTAELLVEKFASGSVSKEEFLKDYNLLMSGISQVRWLGSFDQLISGDEEFAVHLRSLVLLGEPDRPLTCSEAEALADITLEYE